MRNPIFRGGFAKNQYIEGGLGQFADLRGELGEEEGGSVFEGGG